MTATFDAAVYKRTTREQWQDAAEAWHRWGPTLEDWLGEATERMLDLTEVGEGSRVLDVGAGAGGQSLAAARRGATVLATDISESILEYAAAEADILAAVLYSTQLAPEYWLAAEAEETDPLSRMVVQALPTASISTGAAAVYLLPVFPRMTLPLLRICSCGGG